MRKLLQNYGKQILAVVSVLLMIAFFLPSGLSQMGSHDNPVVGYIGKEKIYGREFYSAKQNWDILNRQRVDQEQGGSLAYRLLGPIATGQIEANPDLFTLLLKEARQMGVRVSQDDVETIVRNVLPADLNDADRLDQYRQAVADGLAVSQAFQRAASVIKVSKPLRQHEQETEAQAISVHLVEFDGSRFASQVPAPTPQQLQEQFNKYRNVVRGTASPTTNPFNFGYKYPDRLKFQYIEVPRAEVQRAVEASKLPNRWDVDAWRYYRENPQQFATTQPAPATTQASATQPATTRPFEEVRQDIKNQLIAAETNRLQGQIYDRISATLGADYIAFRGAAGSATDAGTTRPATAPASSLKVPYNTVEYLQALANQVQNTTKVRPIVHSLQDRFMTLQEVMRLPGIGQAWMGRQNLAVYLQVSVAGFVPNRRPEEGNVLNRFQPSPALADSAGNLYILRVTESQPSHSPANLAEVQDQVRADWISEQAYQLARAPAQKLLNEAKVAGLRAAANNAGLRLITTGMFMNQPQGQVPNYPLEGPVQQQFLAEAYKLLSTPPPHPGDQPIRLIELPEAAKLDVAELAGITPLWSAETEYAILEQVQQQVQQQEMIEFMRSWYDYGSVVSRLNYRAVEGELAREPQPPPPAQPPIF